MARTSLVGQIAEVQRELELRARAYPEQVARGRMRQGEADLCVARLADVLATLLWLAKHERTIRQRLSCGDHG